MCTENEILLYHSHYFKLYTTIQLLLMAKFPTNNMHDPLYILHLLSEICRGKSTS